MLAAAQQTPRAVREARRRLILRRFARIARQQRAREAAELGYHEIGGEAGGA